MVSPITRMDRAAKQGFAGKLGQNFVEGLIPGFARDIANDTDQGADGEPVKRTPGNLKDDVEMAVPGLRQ